MKPSLWFRICRAFRVKVLGASPLDYETFDEMRARVDEYYSRPEVIAHLRSLPATHTYSRETGKLTPIKHP